MIHAFPAQASPSVAIPARQPLPNSEDTPYAGGFAVALAAAVAAADGTLPPHDDPSSRRLSFTRDGADVFNARGFFADDAVPHRTTTEGSLAAAYMPAPHAGPIADPAAVEHMIGVTPAAVRQIRSYPAASIAMQPPHGTVPSASASARRATRTPVFATAMARVAVLRPHAPDTPPVAASARPPHRSAPPASIVPVALAISQVDAGLRIVARLDGLDEHARAALQDDIAALVARHGSKATDITVLGRGRSPAFGRGQS